MLGERLRKLRMSKGYSLSELSELAGVSKSYLSYLERNLQTNPSLLFLNKISATLETDIEYLLNGVSVREMELEQKHVLDDEWKRLVQRAIAEGMSKEDFIHFKEYMEFQKWQGLKKQALMDKEEKET
ncbi:helix-turn-helix domain-containing protein [Bacillus tianshenii]|uniref:helix-turn-helix domain-containing protein n=1 Tax=Sutcliffiella tianshenii TaxID=1463404 RepID=UPI001CD5FDEB|nr:helix-turn-helix transcriptional regulator [Bacillus tianshenii]MCA1319643.1 helix-turn-helix domain-containing protein [Bacillus tianshenii]